MKPQPRKKPLILGLVGGIASGKSLVAEAFRGLGAAVINADEVGHEVLELDEVRAEIRNQWGDSVFDAQGRVDRRRLGEQVFGGNADPARRRKLESITHPRIRSRIEAELAALAEGDVPAIVLDVPLLLEVGWHTLCDRIVYVDAADAVRRSRAAGRGWSAEEWELREASQWPVAKKRLQADAVIDNNGGEPATRRQVAQLWEAWHISGGLTPGSLGS